MKLRAIQLDCLSNNLNDINSNQHQQQSVYSSLYCSPDEVNSLAVNMQSLVDAAEPFWVLHGNLRHVNNVRKSDIINAKSPTTDEVT